MFDAENLSAYLCNAFYRLRETVYRAGVRRKTVTLGAGVSIACPVQLCLQQDSQTVQH